MKDRSDDRRINELILRIAFHVLRKVSCWQWGYQQQSPPSSVHQHIVLLLHSLLLLLSLIFSPLSQTLTDSLSSTETTWDSSISYTTSSQFVRKEIKHFVVKTQQEEFIERSTVRLGWSVTGNMEVPDLKTVSSWIDKVMKNLFIWWSWRTTTRNKKNKFSLQNDYDTMGRPFFRDQQSSSRRRAGKREKNLM